MKHKLPMLIFTLILIFTTALGGCGGGGDAVTTPAETTSPTESDGMINIISGGVSEYTIVRMDGESEALTAKKAELRDAITEVTGVTLSYEDGFIKPGSEISDAKQFIIGSSDAVDEADVLVGCDMLDYALRTFGSRIVANGWSEEGACLAADELIKLVRENGKEGSLSFPALDATYSIPVVAAPREVSDDFVFTYYYGPMPVKCTPEAIKLIKECGFTQMQISDYDPDNGGRQSVEVLRAAIENAAAQDMDVSLFMMGGLSTYTSRELPQETVDNEVAAIIERFGDLENLVEWYLRDEPPTSDFPYVAAVADAFHRLDPTRHVFVNLKAGMYDGADESTWELLKAEGFLNYVGDFIDIVSPDYVSFDRYDFKNDPPFFDLGCNYFQDMWAVRSMAMRHSLPAAMTIQSTQYGPINECSCLREEQMRWEANMCLSYGFKSVTYFTYAFLDESGLIDLEGNPTEQYYDVQNISRDLLPLGRQLATTELKMVFHIDTGVTSGGAPKYIPYAPLGEVGGKQAVVGFFEDGSFYITNFEYVTGAAPNVLTLDDVDGSLEWFNPATETWEDATLGGEIEKTDSGYTLTLESGDGILLRAVK